MGYQETGSNQFVEERKYSQWYFVENGQMRVFVEIGATQFRMTNVPSSHPEIGDAFLKTALSFNREQAYLGINREAPQDNVFALFIDNQMGKRINQAFHFVARVMGKNPLEVMNTRPFWVGTIEAPNRRLNPLPGQQIPPLVIYNGTDL